MRATDTLPEQDPLDTLPAQDLFKVPLIWNDALQRLVYIPWGVAG